MGITVARAKHCNLSISLSLFVVFVWIFESNLKVLKEADTFKKPDFYVMIQETMFKYKEFCEWSI